MKSIKWYPYFYKGKADKIKEGDDISHIETANGFRGKVGIILGYWWFYLYPSFSISNNCMKTISIHFLCYWVQIGIAQFKQK